MSSRTAARGGMRAHIAMVGATTPSHVHPGLALIRELAARGHRVTYVVGERLAPLVRPTGAEVIACTTVLPAEDDPKGWPSDPIEAMALFLDEGIRVLPQMMHAYGPDRPDLVLHDIGGLAGPVAAARWGVPAVQLSPSIDAWEGYEEEMAEQIAGMKSSPAAQRYYARFESWLTYNGVARDPDDVLGRPDQGLVLIPRVLQPHAERVSPAFRFVGPCIDERRLDRLNGWTRPADGRKLVYVSLGTAYTGQPGIYRACIEAFGATDWQLLLSIGHRVDPADLGDLPDNVEVRRTVPQLEVLRRASAFVTHAGMGSTIEALWFGVPMVAIPQAADQFSNAGRIAELGVGHVLHSDGIDAHTVSASVAELTRDGPVGTRLAELRAELRRAGGAVCAADAVETILAQTR